MSNNNNPQVLFLILNGTHKQKINIKNNHNNNKIF
jgi:hypothetical protein